MSDLTAEQKEYLAFLTAKTAAACAAVEEEANRIIQARRHLRPCVKPSPLREFTDDRRRRYKAGEINEQEYRAEMRAYVRLFGSGSSIETDEEIERRDTAADYAPGTYNG